MSANTGSTHSKYAGLLPIEPSDDFFRPIDLKPELIDLRPEPIDLVPFPYGPPSSRKRPRVFARFPMAFCAGVAAAWLWQSYGDTAREMIASSHRPLGWLAPRSALIAQNPHPSDVRAPSVEQSNAMSIDLDVVGQGTDKTAATIATGQEPTMRITDQTAASVDQAPATNDSSVTVESRRDEASSQPTVHQNVKPTEARPPQALAEKGRPLAPCFVSASAVLQSHPGGWPTWTFKAPGHEGTVCWYAATRPNGSDHRRERVARKEMVGTTENRLSAPLAPYGRGGSWEGGAP
jgi:hypothetical protein